MPCEAASAGRSTPDRARAIVPARGRRPADVDAPLPGFQRTNFAVACAAVREHLGMLDDAVVERVAARITVPGRMQVVAEDPLTILDGAHNPSGVEALAAALPERPFVGVVSILDDKDAAAMLRALLRRCAHVRLHRGADAAGAAPRHPGLARRAARGRRRDRPEPARGRRSRARDRRPGGRRGGHRLDLPDRRPRLRPGPPEGLRTVNDGGPSVLGMVALVAVVVALTILIFFALGYALGKIFL